MRRSLSNPAGAFHSPKSADLITERDQAWYVGLTLEECSHYYELAFNKAYSILGSRCEAEMVADKVIDELLQREQPPPKTQLEPQVLVLARSRALDYRKSPRHRLWMMCRSLIQKNEDGEEYMAVPASYCCPGAEEEFFAKGEQELFAQRYAQALSHLNDQQRICFVMRVEEHLKPEEIAEILNIPAGVVHTQTYRARNKIAKFLSRQEGKQNK